MSNWFAIQERGTAVQHILERIFRGFMRLQVLHEYEKHVHPLATDEEIAGTLEKHA